MSRCDRENLIRYLERIPSTTPNIHNVQITSAIDTPHHNSTISGALFLSDSQIASRVVSFLSLPIFLFDGKEITSPEVRGRGVDGVVEVFLAINVQYAHSGIIGSNFLE